MRTRLDFLEMYNRELRDALVAQGNGTRKVDDILALVAVARAAKMLPCASDMRRDLEGSGWNAASINALCGALAELDAALEPLIYRAGPERADVQEGK